MTTYQTKLLRALEHVSAVKRAVSDVLGQPIDGSPGVDLESLSTVKASLGTVDRILRGKAQEDGVEVPEFRR